MAEDSRPTVVVVGPFGPSSAGGVVTFQRNLTEKSSLKERWRFVPFSTARPPKEATLNNYSYDAIFNSGVRRLAQGVGITAWHLLTFVGVLRRERAVAVQAPSTKRDIDMHFAALRTAARSTSSTW